MIDVERRRARRARTCTATTSPKDVGPGKTAKFRFKANLEGIYELELHDSGAQLAEVRVDP